ncbi:hypothetical protein EVAR_35428_1 [Eumeta japonica]|uniref:Uncharacterized protein n=1 Tax=Eumeta variegata TaxID=151549 RepID=A0A4C1XAW2_EUMVA|nr:hypothetical protein EVAR_35428_1 [Eumeta japonica]
MALGDCCAASRLAGHTTPAAPRLGTSDSRTRTTRMNFIIQARLFAFVLSFLSEKNVKSSNSLVTNGASTERCDFTSVVRENALMKSRKTKRAVDGNENAVTLSARLALDSANASAVDGNSSHDDLIERFQNSWPVWRWRQCPFYSDDVLKTINEHWLQFPPPEPAVHRALGGFYVLFATLGCSGNLIVLYMYIR